MDPIEKHFAYHFNKERHTHHIEEARKERQVQAVQSHVAKDEAAQTNIIQTIINVAKRARNNRVKRDATKSHRSETNPSVDLDSAVMI